MKDFFKTLLDGICTTCIGIASMSLIPLDIYLLYTLSESSGWEVIGEFILGIVGISVGILGLWTVGKIRQKENTDD